MTVKTDPQPHADATLDARGLKCPLPVLKTRKRLEPLAAGAVLEVTADDPAAWIDVPHFCVEQGHRLLAQEDRGDAGALVFWIEKAG